MNEHILNLVEKLKDCPKGTSLYSPMFGEVLFYGITDSKETPIEVTLVDMVHHDEEELTYAFTADGRLDAKFPNAECMLFPSSENRDWSTFVPPTQEAEAKVHTVSEDDKQLLIQDLCARLPYGVMVQFISRYDNKKEIEILRDVEFRNNMPLVSTTTWNNLNVEWCKPYLRSMNDMTKDEKEELLKSVFRRRDSELFKVTSDGIDALPVEVPANSHILFSVNSVNFNNRNINKYTEFLNRHHFDYRGLIKKGLAIKVIQENNPYKNN